MVQKPHKIVRNIPYLLCLKGYAALWIFSIHLGGPLRTINEFFYWLNDHGKDAIVMFFLLSAFVISKLVLMDKHFSFRSYIIRRFFRIAPVYYLILIVVSVFHYNITDLLYHLLFLNVALIAPKYQSSILGVEWSVPIQFWYYFLIPFITLLFVKRHWIMPITFLGSIVLYFKENIFFVYNGIGSYGWSMQHYFFVYILGIYVAVYIYKYSMKLTNNENIFHILVIVLTLILIGFGIKNTVELLFLFTLVALYIVAIFSKYLNYSPLTNSLIIDASLLGALVWLGYYVSYARLNPILFVTLWSGLLILLLERENHLSKFLFQNNLVGFIGIISFPFYLIHYPLLNLMSKLILFNNMILTILFKFILIIVISAILHYGVEKPVQVFSKRVWG